MFLPVFNVLLCVLRAQIVWSGDRIQTLLQIEREVTRAGLIGAARERELERRWCSKNPRLPTKGSGLKQQLYRSRRIAKAAQQDSENEQTGEPMEVDTPQQQDPAQAGILRQIEDVLLEVEANQTPPTGLEMRLCRVNCLLYVGAAEVVRCHEENCPNGTMPQKSMMKLKP